MTEFAYIEHLDIPEKRRGSILHAEEYNATVGKINEIVDSLQASYNYNNSLPNFDEISDISQINTENGTPVIIHNIGEKYYPVTSSAYVTVGDNKYLDTELTYIKSELDNVKNDVESIEIPSYYGTDTINIENSYVSVNVDNIVDGSYLTVEDNKIKLDSESLLSDVNSKINTNASNIAALDTKIDTEIDNVQQDVLALSNIVNDFNVPSYYGTDTIDINDNQISVNTSYLISYIIDNDTIIAYNDKIKVNAEEVISELSEDIENKINHVNDLIEDVSNVVKQLESSVSYFPGDGINIDENNVVSVDLSYIADNIIDTAYLSVIDGKIGVDADTLLQDVKDDISYNTTFIGDVNSKIDTEIANINNTLDELSYSIISEIPSYIAGDGINIDENNVISLDTSYLIEDVEKPSIYLNEDGKLVVNNEVVLANAESQFKFIDENGNWVGDMANVKNYIDEHDTALDNKMDNIKNEIYTYVSKFTEYDTLGKDYAPSVEFINRNK